MRKRRAQGQQAAASGAFSSFFYAFRSLFWRGLDNLSYLPAGHAVKALKWLAYFRPKCVDREAIC